MPRASVSPRAPTLSLYVFLYFCFFCVERGFGDIVEKSLAWRSEDWAWPIEDLCDIHDISLVLFLRGLAPSHPHPKVRHWIYSATLPSIPALGSIERILPKLLNYPARGLRNAAFLLPCTPPPLRPTPFRLNAALFGGFASSYMCLNSLFNVPGTYAYRSAYELEFWTAPRKFLAVQKLYNI